MLRMYATYRRGGDGGVCGRAACWFLRGRPRLRVGGGVLPVGWSTSLSVFLVLFVPAIVRSECLSERGGRGVMG